MLTGLATLPLVLSVYCYICFVIYVNRYSPTSPGVVIYIYIYVVIYVNRYSHPSPGVVIYIYICCYLC